MNIIQIEPIVKELTYFGISQVNVDLLEGAVVSYVITDDKSISVTGTLTMDKVTYDNWGSDDSYVYQWALTQLGLKPKK